MRPKILLITYYFPPCGGAAVQRWLRWLPELVAAGYFVDVITISDGDYPFRDDSLLDRIPSDVKVFRTPAPRIGRLWKFIFGKHSSMPYGSLSMKTGDPLLKRILVWIRINLIIPDMRVFWNHRAFRQADDLLRKAPYSLVITTGPPHSTHLIGLRLKTTFGVRWFADWRDPWTGIYYLKLNPPTRWSMRKQSKLERQVAENADLNICVSRYLASQIPGMRKLVLYNGFDSKSTPREKTSSQVFRIKYIGQITEGQDTNLLLDVLHGVANHFSPELSFIGTRLEKELEDRLFLIPAIKLRKVAFVSHEEALGEVKEAELLVLLINSYEGYEGMLTTKLFEYLGSGNPILSLGPHGSEAEQLILEYDAGRHYCASESEAAVDWVVSLIRAADTRDIDANIKDIYSLSAQHQSVKLIEAIRG